MNMTLLFSIAYGISSNLLQIQIGLLDKIIILVYGIGMLGIGWYYYFRQKNKEDYYLGGRTVNPVIAGISMYVAFFSAISYLAIPGEVVRYGALYPLAILVGTPVIYLLGSYFLIPFFMNLPILSAYEILKKPLGEGMRQFGSFVFIITRLLWMALLIYLASKAMVVMMGWDESYILIITIVLGIITLLYTTMGGLEAVIVTDVIQFLILLLGTILTIIIVSVKTGGFLQIFPENFSDNWKNVSFISFNPYVRLTIFFAFINNIAWWFCTAGSDQMAIQRFISTRDLKSARRTFMFTQIGQASIVILLLLVGLSVMSFYNLNPELLPSGNLASADKDFLFPYFIASQFPAGLLGLIIAALFSASMSSLSAGVNSMSSVITADILPLIIKDSKKIDNIKNIRLMSALIGVVVILLSLLIDSVPGNIIEVTTKTNGLFVAPLFSLFFSALFIKKAKPFGVFMGAGYGFMTAFLIGFWDVITGNPPMSFLWITFMSLISSVLFSLIFNLIFPSIKGKKSVLVGLLLLVPWIVLFILI